MAKKLDISQAAKLLGRKLVGSTPGVHGVSTRRKDPNVPELYLSVDIDTDKVAVLKKIPSTWYGYDVHFRIAKMPIITGKQTG